MPTAPVEGSPSTDGFSSDTRVPVRQSTSGERFSSSREAPNVASDVSTGLGVRERVCVRVL
jgi:hypothetical protein